MNFFFQKMNLKKIKLKLYIFSIIYYKYCEKGSEIIQSVAYICAIDFNFFNVHIKLINFGGSGI
jgi:hypothetical protein